MKLKKILKEFGAMTLAIILSTQTMFTPAIFAAPIPPSDMVKENIKEEQKTQEEKLEETEINIGKENDETKLLINEEKAVNEDNIQELSESEDTEISTASEEIQKKKVFNVNFYKNGEVIFASSVEEGGSLELPDMSDDDTFIGWQIDGADFDADGYEVTGDMDIVGIFEEPEAEVELVESSLTKECEGYVINATGNMPANAELSVNIIDSTEDIEEQVNNSLPEFQLFTVYKAFDIDILVNGEKWQPVDFDEIVNVSIENIEIETIKEEICEREVTKLDIETNEVEHLSVEDINDVVFRVENEDVTELVSAVCSEEVAFETEHFTVFTVGGISYNTSSATLVYELNVAGPYGSLCAHHKLYWFPESKILYWDTPTETSNSGSAQVWLSLNRDGVTFDINDYPAETIVLAEGWIGFYQGDATPTPNPSVKNVILPSTITSGRLTSTTSAFCSVFPNVEMVDMSKAEKVEAKFKFTGCTNLKTVKLPYAQDIINTEAFKDCTSLESVILPDTIQEINSDAFYNCTNLVSVGTNLPSSLTYMGSNAFGYCSSLELTGDIPAGVNNLGSSIFNGCDYNKCHFDKNLSSYNIQNTHQIPTTYIIKDIDPDNNVLNTETHGAIAVSIKYLSRTDAPEYKDLVLNTINGSSSESVGVNIFIAKTAEEDFTTVIRAYREKTYLFTYKGKDYYQEDATNSYTAGDNITAYWYESDGVLGFVGLGAMNNWASNTTPWYSIKSNITDVYLSDEITTLGNYAFYNCIKLKAINALPSGLTTIGDCAFYGCRNLALRGELPSGLTSVGNYAFSSCSNLTLSGTLPSGITTIGNSAFYNCCEITFDKQLPGNLETLGDKAFHNCPNLALTGDIPESVTSIGFNVFTACDLEKTHFARNLSDNVAITSGMDVPTSYTVVDTFSDGKKANITTTKYGYVGAMSDAGTAPTYDCYILGSDCTNTAIKIGKLDSDALVLSRTYNPESYTVSFNSDGGTPISAQTVNNGTQATIPTSPLKDGSPDGYGDADYTFKEWQKDGYAFDFDTAITEDITLNATYYEPIKVYLSANGGTYRNKVTGNFTDTIEYYVTPSQNLNISLPSNYEEAKKIGYELEGYTYSGVTYSKLPFVRNEIAIPNGGNMTFSAKWSSAVAYDITYDYGTGTAPETENPVSYTVEDNVVINNYPTAPAHYKFTGFSLKSTDDDSLIIEQPFQPLYWFNGTYAQNLTVVANYTNKDVYAITLWTDKENGLSVDVLVEEGDSLEEPSAPNKPGYTLDGWYDAEGNKITFPYTPIADEEFEAKWIKNPVATFNAGDGTFSNGEHTVDVFTDSDGKVTTAPIPTLTGHTFDHWEIDGHLFVPETDVLSGDKEITAVWNANDIVFTFYGADNKSFRTYTLKYGDSTALKVDVPAPIKEGNTFTGWNPSIPVTATENKQFYPNFRVNTYTIKFIDGLKGSTISDKSYSYGSTIDVPSLPLYPGYKTTGWTPSVNKICKGNVIYTANYSQNEYIVKFLDWDYSVISNKTDYHYGDTLIQPKEPTRIGYRFIGWNEAVEPTITGSHTYIARYEEDGHIVKFLDYDGRVISSTRYSLGDSVVIPPNPTRLGYSFKNWDKPIYLQCMGDATYTALYEQNIVKKYVVMFKDYDGREIDIQTYNLGDVISIPSEPRRDGYNFRGWTPSVSRTCNGSIVYRANYDKKEDETRYYTITFMANGQIVSSQKIQGGAQVVVPSAPVVSGYIFKAWSPAVSITASADVTYTALYDAATKQEEPKKESETTLKKEEEPEPEPQKEDEIPEPIKDTFQVKFLDKDGKLILQRTYEAGSKLVEPTPRKVEGYTFKGWSPNVENVVVKDAIYKATYYKAAMTEKEEEKKPEHTHTLICESIDDEYHIIKCKVPDCEYQKKEKHIFNDKGVCLQCKLQKKVPKKTNPVITGGIIAGVLTLGFVALGKFTALGLLLLNLLFVKKRKKWHGMLTDEDNKFVKVQVKSGDDDKRVYVEYIIEANTKKGIVNVEDYITEITNCGYTTILPYNTEMVITYTVGEEVKTDTLSVPDENKFFDILRENAGKEMKITLNLINEKADLDIMFEYTV